MVTGQENIPGRKPSSNIERSLVGKGVGEVGSARAGGLRHAVGALESGCRNAGGQRSCYQPLLTLFLLLNPLQIGSWPN